MEIVETESETAWRDVQFLAGSLPHRGGVTEKERRAAEYLRARFESATLLTQVENFHSIDAFPFLFAMYYAEFFVVAAIGVWLPWVALGYGVVVFMLYMGEFTGYASLSRFLPQFETQNVTARMPCSGAQRIVVVTAHYDSPKAYPWTDAVHVTRLRAWHMWLVVAMVVVLVSCGAQGFGVFDSASVRVDWLLRAAAVGVLLVGAGALYAGARRSEFTRGANTNATGSAALVVLAHRLSARPLSHTEVVFVATGAKEMWLSGMRHFFKGLRGEKSSTCFLNLASVGAGALRYVTGEGMLHVFSAGRELIEAAQASGPEFAARPLVWRNLPTDALIPLARGYSAMTIMATDENDLPSEWLRESDTLSHVDMGLVLRASDFAESILRRLDGVAVSGED